MDSSLLSVIIVYLASQKKQNKQKSKTKAKTRRRALSIIPSPTKTTNQSGRGERDSNMRTNAVVNEAHLSPLAAAEQRRLASDVTVWPHSRLRPEEEQSGKCAAAEQ